MFFHIRTTKTKDQLVYLMFTSNSLIMEARHEKKNFLRGFQAGWTQTRDYTTEVEKIRV